MENIQNQIKQKKTLIIHLNQKDKTERRKQRINN